MNLFISAMDFSSDIHAANLIKKLKNKLDVYVYALGGRHLKETSDFFIKDATRYSTVGFVEATGVIYRLRQLLETSKKYIEICDCVIACDSFAFNRYIIKTAKKMNKKVYYYISPQVWASRQNRVFELKEYTDKVFVIFPFEEDFLKKFGVNAFYVGHPYLEVLTYRKLNPYPLKIGLFPGSRRSYIKRHYRLYLKVAEYIAEKYGAEFSFYTFNSPQDEKLIKNEPPPARDINFAFSTSGTITLENGLSGIPSVVAMKVGFINFLIARLITKINKIAMPNILLGKEIYPELIESDATYENIISAFEYVLIRYEKINSELKKLWEVFYSKNIYNLIELICD